MAYPIAVTPGEPAGIGPDLCLQLASRAVGGDCFPVLIADPDLLAQRARLLGLDVGLELFDPARHLEARTDTLYVVPVSLAETAFPGTLDPANGAYVLETLSTAVAGCLEGRFSALVTGPVQKSVINEAGIPFSGHTELLAQLCRCDQVVMMLATEGLRVALATTHIPLSQVAGSITGPLLKKVLKILHDDLQQKFGITAPRILVSGLNPHAGEQGHLGREEIDIIIPALQQCRREGMNLHGPLPADTLFTEKYLKDADAVLAMFHDQGLPVLKYRGFGKAVNITLGLPIIRTSVDHGTALDLAGSGKADPGSLLTALDYASNMVSAGKSA